MVQYFTKTPYNTDADNSFLPIINRKKYLFVVVSCVVMICVITTASHLFTPSEGRVSCPRPTASAPKKFSVVPLDQVRKTVPMAIPRISIRVLNATTVRNEAKTVLQALKQQGFREGASPLNNDPVYTADSLQCSEQIRFGISQLSAAASLRYLFPCAQFINDGRKDSVLDVAIGTQFTGLSTTNSTNSTLIRIRSITPGKLDADIGSDISCPTGVKKPR